MDVNDDVNDAGSARCHAVRDPSDIAEPYRETRRARPLAWLAPPSGRPRQAAHNPRAQLHFVDVLLSQQLLSSVLSETDFSSIVADSSAETSRNKNNKTFRGESRKNARERAPSCGAWCRSSSRIATPPSPAALALRQHPGPADPACRPDAGPAGRLEALLDRGAGRARAEARVSGVLHWPALARSALRPRGPRVRLLLALPGHRRAALRCRTGPQALSRGPPASPALL